MNLSIMACHYNDKLVAFRCSFNPCFKGMLKNTTVNKLQNLSYCTTSHIGRFTAATFRINNCGNYPPKPMSAVMCLNKEFYSKQSSSLPSNLFELVAEDIQILNKNLLSIGGAENPGLMYATKHMFGCGGKRIRPALVFLVSKATAKNVGLKEVRVSEEQRRLAECIEIIHAATLIHDDVIDESSIRRGNKTVNEVYGVRVAVIAGVFLLAQSSSYLANLGNFDVMKLVNQVIEDCVIGEVKQAFNLFNCDIELDEYLTKSYYKTASFIAATTKSASILSGVNEDISEEMHQYGKNLGLSFQIVDDILDFTQSSDQLGKPAKSDLAKGNLSAPVIFALENEPKLRDIIESKFSEKGSVEEAIKLVEKSGGIEMARELARKKSDEAVECLQCLPSSYFRTGLQEMVEYNLERMN